MQPIDSHLDDLDHPDVHTKLRMLANSESSSGRAYVEEWRLVPDTRRPLSRASDGAGRHVYRAGDAAVVVRDRPTPRPRLARLDRLIDECGDDRDRLSALVDCECSFARRRDDRFVIEASTMPWREGAVVDVDIDLR